MDGFHESRRSPPPPLDNVGQAHRRSGYAVAASGAGDCRLHSSTVVLIMRRMRACGWLHDLVCQRRSLMLYIFNLSTATTTARVSLALHVSPPLAHRDAAGAGYTAAGCTPSADAAPTLRSSLLRSGRRSGRQACDRGCRGCCEDDGYCQPWMDKQAARKSRHRILRLRQKIMARTLRPSLHFS